MTGVARAHKSMIGATSLLQTAAQFRRRFGLCSIVVCLGGYRIVSLR
jgi:hypothetical protein